MRLVLTTVGTTGDVRPMVALADALAGRGHTVRACSYALHREPFEARGIEFVPVGPEVDWDRIAREGARVGAEKSPLKQFELLRDFHLREGAEHYRHCREATRDFDLAICHGVHTLGQAAVLDNEVPWVRVLLEPTLVPTAHATPAPGVSLGRWLNPAAWTLLERSLGKLDRPLGELLRAAGSGQSGMKMFRTPSKLLNLHAYSAHLAPPPPDLPAASSVTGFWELDEPETRLPGAVERFLELHPRAVAVTFGSMAGERPRETLRLILDALERAELPAIVQRGVARLDADEVPENVLLTGALPHASLFPRVSCVVHHGGAGTTATASRAGVPSVVVPHVGDQFFWAQRLHAVGVAPRPLPLRRLTSENLASRLLRATDLSDLAHRAVEIARRMRTEGGLPVAISRLEAAAG